MNRVIFIIAIVALIAFLAHRFPYTLDNEDAKMRVVYLSVLIASFALSSRQFPLNQTIKYGIAWIAIAGVLIAGYSYKHEIMNTRIMREIMPNQARINEDGSLSIRASEGGHYFVEGLVNGVAVNFMVDTGASDISLSKDDASRAGIDTSTLSFTRLYNTANGNVMGASVRLKSLKIGDFVLNDFPASVNGGEMQGSLLGMEAINAMGGIKIDGNEMIIGK